MRVYQHIVDTMAVKTTLNAIPHHWVVRDLSERDYGIDLMVEIFRKVGSNKHGHDYYDTTGAVCYLQLKGTDEEFEYDDDGVLSYSLDKNTLLYVEKFSTPFILVRVSVVDKKEKIHFLWLQRYIMEVLDFEIPDWRERKKKSKEGEKEEYQNSFTIRVPKSNSLPEKADKIEKIASRIKYIEEHSEFHGRWMKIESHLAGIVSQPDDYDGFNDLFKEVGRIKRFNTLFSYNDCCIDGDCVNELTEYIKRVEQGVETPTELEHYPHNYNFGLLRDEGRLRIDMEKIIADHEDDTTY